jgi:predicted DNA binding CopG/RHH family protein
VTKKIRYDDEELEILQALEAGSLKPVTETAQRRNSHMSVAAATFKKDQRLNIRISGRDLKHPHSRRGRSTESTRQTLSAEQKAALLLQSQSGFARTTLMSPAEDSWNSI